MFWQSLRYVLRYTTVFLILISASLAAKSAAQAEGSRRTKSRVEPAYPELARRMNIRGTVKLAAVVAPNGTVKDVQVIGGHPVLANAAMEAVRKWRFEPASEETTENLQFLFDPN